jgi:hypothetical protein
MANGTCTFQTTGGKIDLSLNVGRVIFGRGNGMDLGDLEGGPVSTMFLDPVVLANTVWANYQDLLNEQGIDTQDDFNKLLAAKQLRELESGMKVAISDFFTWGPQVIEQISERINNLIADPVPSGPLSGEPPESSE